MSWVRDVADMDTLLCVVGDSRLMVHDSIFSRNSARPMALFNQSSLLLTASNISNNSVAGYGGGILVSDDANVTITGKSRVLGNNASLDGGGGVGYEAFGVEVGRQQHCE